jgi:heterodisulfide reductase subunit D
MKRVTIWAGCTSRYFLAPTLASLEKILNHLGRKMVLIDDGSVCCGSVLYTTGRKRKASSNRLEVEKVLNKKRVTDLVSVCPGCTRTFKEFYLPRKNNKLRSVKHITELLSEELDNLKFKKKRKKLKITYHDPCHLGRHMFIYDEPRRILNALPGVEFIEMNKTMDESFCCGSGGGVRACNKEMADTASGFRLSEAKGIDADLLVTSCPFCERSFVSAKNKLDPKVLNLIDLVADYL